MLVQGELEKAQLEQVADAAPSFKPTGRVYIDVTNPLAAVPKIYNGTDWKTFLLAQATATVDSNSGKAVTVDWSRGLNQQVTLTDNAVISFSNPQEGQIHTLFVVQNSATQYVCTFDMQGQETGRAFAQQPGPLALAGITSFSWFYKSGLKPAVPLWPALGPAPTLAALISGNMPSMSMAPDGYSFVAARAGSPFHVNYGLAPVDIQTQVPFLNGLSAPPALAAAANGSAYASNGKAVYFAFNASPFLIGFALRQLGQVTDAFQGPALAGAGTSVSVHPNSTFVAAGHVTTPFVSVFPTDGQAIGTKLANPGTLPPATVQAVAFSPHGDYLAVASQTTPFLQTYAFTATGAGSIGAQVANPSVLPAGGPTGAVGKGIAWRPQGDFIAMAMTTTPFLYVVPFNRTTGAYGTPLTISALGGALNSVCWSPDGQYLFAGGTASPFMYAWDFSAFTIGAPISFAVLGPPILVQDVTIHSSGDYLLVSHAVSPFMRTYTVPSKAKSYLRIR